MKERPFISVLIQELVWRNYSRESANIIAAQYFSNGQAGTEKSTAKDVLEILTAHNQTPKPEFLQHKRWLDKF